MIFGDEISQHLSFSFLNVLFIYLHFNCIVWLERFHRFIQWLILNFTDASNRSVLWIYFGRQFHEFLGHQPITKRLLESVSFFSYSSQFPTFVGLYKPVANIDLHIGNRHPQTSFMNFRLQRTVKIVAKLPKVLQLKTGDLPPFSFIYYFSKIINSLS